MKCTLCTNTNTTVFFVGKKRTYFHCNNCNTILLDPNYYLKPLLEKARYDLHNDTIEDEGYQNFVAPLVNRVCEYYIPNSSLGLDYGCGKTAIVKRLLEQKGFDVKGYDPIYFPNTPIFEPHKYNFITCCEVVEHFYNPKIEFNKLHQLLLPKGKLLLKTNLYNESINFDSWWYKNDPTHVIFYTKNSLQFIKETLQFSDLEIYSDHIIFTK